LPVLRFEVGAGAARELAEAGDVLVERVRDDRGGSVLYGAVVGAARRHPPEFSKLG